MLMIPIITLWRMPVKLTQNKEIKKLFFPNYCLIY